MRFAQVTETSHIVEASKSLLGKYGSYVYRCSTCGSRVFLRLGDWRKPHFAHFPGEGSADCEDYRPGSGGGTSQNYSICVGVEDSADKAGLCLEDNGQNWSIYLRLPEIPNDELGAVSLSALQSAQVEVYAGNVLLKPLKAIELRPGVGSARVSVIPTSDRYATSPSGKWPANVYTGRWELTSDGLTQIGTLFRFSCSEWVRLRPRSLVKWGESLCVVTHAQVHPPLICSPIPVRKTHTSSAMWMLWRIVLPQEPSAAVERWLESLDHSVAEPMARVKILSIPDSFDPETRLSQFTHGTPLIAKVSVPYAGAKSLLALYFSTNRIVEPVNPDPNSSDTYFEISLATPGICSLEVDAARETVAEFAIINQHRISDIRHRLSQLPKLRLSIGPDHFEAWSDQKTAIAINKLNTDPEVSINLGIEGCPIDLTYSSHNERIVRTQISPREVERLLKSIISKRRRGNLRVDAGALGSIDLALITIEKKEEHSEKEIRIAPWLACISATRAEGPPSNMNPAVLHNTFNNVRLLVASVRNVAPAVAAQLRSMAKKQAHSHRRDKR